jgi:carbamoyltransferase
MRVLGISPLDKDSTVSFVEDGRVVFACGEERLTRVKLQSGFPHSALTLGFRATGWNKESIDIVAYGFFDGKEEGRLISYAHAADQKVDYAEQLRASARNYSAATSAHYSLDRSVLIPGFDSESDEFLTKKPLWKRICYEACAKLPSVDRWIHQRTFNQWKFQAIEDHEKWSQELEIQLTKLGLREKLKRYHHHETHAANAFYSSGAEKALCVVLDGYGSGCCGGIYRADADGIKVLHRFVFPASLGIFYEQVTSGLAFRPSRHEGKIVGLAAYGKPEILESTLSSRFVVKDGDIRIAGAQNTYLARALAGHFAKRDVAAAYQRVLERVTCQCVSYWIQKTGLTSLVLSGGVHANVKLNQRIAEIDGVDSVFVYPNMGDGGCATGAAFLALGHEACYGKAFDSVYFGPQYDDEDIKRALDKESLSYQDLGSELEKTVAHLLANDSIVARVNGRMEYGPRALGNRSILYPAKRPEVNQWLNEQLGRTEFMPFAPVCLAERADQLFVGIGQGTAKTAEFMTITYDCTELMKRQSPAAVHVDGTARPQLVTARSNPSMHAILREYEAITGIPVLINTSFNMHEEPIVCSPEDSIRAFLLGNIDYLAIGKFLVKHPSRLAKSQH